MLPTLTIYFEPVGVDLWRWTDIVLLLVSLRQDTGYRSDSFEYGFVKKLITC